MKQLSIGFMVVAELVLVALALNGILSEFWRFPVNPIFGWLPPALLESGPVAIRTYWLAVLLLPILHLVFTWMHIRESRSVMLKRTETGTISLRQSAIVPYMRHALSQVRAIIDHRMRVREVNGGALAVSISIKLRPGDKVAAVQAQIEEIVRKELTDLLGVEKIDKIDIVIEDFGERQNLPSPQEREIPIPARPAISVPEPPESVPFGGEREGPDEGEIEAWIPDQSLDQSEETASENETDATDEEEADELPEPEPLDTTPREIKLAPSAAPIESIEVVPPSDDDHDAR